MTDQKLLIKDVDCWKCGKDMKIALLLSDTSFEDPSTFSPKLLELARKHGVKIALRHSKMLDETYNTNICPHCDSIWGKMFLSQYWYEEDSYVVQPD
jgi:hypothetical protein